MNPSFSTRTTNPWPADHHAKPDGLDNLAELTVEYFASGLAHAERLSPGITRAILKRAAQKLGETSHPIDVDNPFRNDVLRSGNPIDTATYMGRDTIIAPLHNV